MQQTTFNRLQEVRKEMPKRELRRIHLEMVDAVENLKKCEVQVIKKLQEVDHYLVHRFIGYKSLKQYALQALRLSEKQAEALITVARKAATLPALQEAIEKGEVTTFKVVRVTSVINEQNQEHWLHMLRHSSKREIEKEVAKANPRAAVGERARYLNEHLLLLEHPITEKGIDNLERARNLLSQAKRRYVSLEETVDAVTEFFLERQDPLRKAERSQARAEKKMAAANTRAEADQSIKEQVPNDQLTKTLPGQEVENKSSDAAPNRPKQAHGYSRSIKGGRKERHRQPISAATKHALDLRDQRKCQHRMPNGEICGEERWVDTHHIIPVTLGGTNELENLITLCRAHHELWHCEPIQLEELNGKARFTAQPPSSRL